MTQGTDPLSALAGRRVAITGGLGFVGQNVTRLLLERGATVLAIQRTVATAPKPGLGVASIDVLDGEAIANAIGAFAPHVVIHAAGLANWTYGPAATADMMRIHGIGTANVLEAARRASCERLVLLGSAGEYGDVRRPVREDEPCQPRDAYSVSKLAATELALTYDRAMGLPCVVVRPFWSYGPGEPSRRIFATIFAAVRSGERTLAFTPGEQVRDFIFVRDVAEGLLRAAVLPAARGLAINLGTGSGTTVRNAVRVALKVTGASLIADFGALPYRPGEPPMVVADTTRLQDVLDWRPTTSLEDGLRRTWLDLTRTS